MAFFVTENLSKKPYHFLQYVRVYLRKGRIAPAK